jgi:hypothetical protein
VVAHNREVQHFVLCLDKVESDWLKTQTFIEAAELFIIAIEASASAVFMPLECRTRQ